MTATKNCTPRKFNGQIRLYWQGLGSKEDIIVNVRDPEVYAAMEAMHGLQELEKYDAWQNNPLFTEFYEALWFKCEAYADRMKKLNRVHTDKWDWDWVS